MKIETVHLVYYSATYTTRKIARRIASALGVDVVEHDVTNDDSTGDISVSGAGDLLVIAAPVFAGRVPAQAAGRLARVKGSGQPAIVVSVYGNRDYEDALLELKDITEAAGFVPVGAAAFIAQHSIFSEVATGRPDEKDLNAIDMFANRCHQIIRGVDHTDELEKFAVSGNRPYRNPGNIPLKPHGRKSQCNDCKMCAQLCPQQAIPFDQPHRTMAERCIACGRCIAICPEKARTFKGVVFSIARMRFVKDNAVRREPDCYYCDQQPVMQPSQQP